MILEIAPLYGCMQFETLFQNIDFNLYCIICLGHKITSYLENLSCLFQINNLVLQTFVLITLCSGTTCKCSLVKERKATEQVCLDQVFTWAWERINYEMQLMYILPCRTSNCLIVSISLANIGAKSKSVAIFKIGKVFKRMV